jgi:hypothetical protein
MYILRRKEPRTSNLLCVRGDETILEGKGRQSRDSQTLEGKPLGISLQTSQILLRIQLSHHTPTRGH